MAVLHLPRRGLCFFAVEVEHQHRRAKLREPVGDRVADARRAARHEPNSAVQVRSAPVLRALTSFPGATVTRLCGHGPLSPDDHLSYHAVRITLSVS